MMFLERNLEQLTVVQRQLVEQNSSLKKEVAIAERKLIARNERIQSLESLLQDSQEKLTAANHRYVFPVILHLHALTQHSFESQLTAVKERLEAAKAGSTRGLGSPSAGASFAFGGGAQGSQSLFAEEGEMALPSQLSVIFKSRTARARRTRASERAGSSTSGSAFWRGAFGYPAFDGFCFGTASLRRRSKVVEVQQQRVGGGHFFLVTRNECE
jgi:hypothetical protein